MKTGHTGNYALHDFLDTLPFGKTKFLADKASQKFNMCLIYEHPLWVKVTVVPIFALLAQLYTLSISCCVQIIQVVVAS